MNSLTTRKKTHPLLHFSSPFTGGLSLFKEDLEDVFGDMSILPKMFKNSPKTNIIEDEKQYLVNIATPGVSKDKIKVSIDNSILTVSSENKEEKDEKGEGFTLKEFSYLNFSRSFNLPENVDVDGITSKYVDGVLNISIPKTVEVKAAKTITVE